MGPDEEKQLRQLLRKSQQLPEPSWNLFARATKRFSRAIQLEEKTKAIPDGKVTKDRKKRQTRQKMESNL